MTTEATVLSVRRSLNGNPEPHEVTLAPAELHPFALRFLFRLVEDDAGARCLILVATPHLIERSSSGEVLAEVTADLQRTLDENRDRYRRIAELALDVRLAEAVEERELMLAATQSNARRTRPYLVDLAKEYRSLLADPPVRGVLEVLAAKRFRSVRTIQRDLDRAEIEGLLPPGVRPRRS